MNEGYDMLDLPNFTSAGTSQMQIQIERESISIENIELIDNDFEESDIGRLYFAKPEQFIKIQKISKGETFVFYCILDNDGKIDRLKFDHQGMLIS
ncbi:hypothetical protein [Psychroflexus aestuariivivens]|uniref:hypothetical protein n=1 Tax=Psychroflexus aestuariivivens TaxID=1795040 RepID=UPI000FD98AD2|nr:hypothetical protein [Psychroflexus aestuariivivens]